MIAITNKLTPESIAELNRAEHAAYISQRVLDALLREDVRCCVSAGEVVSAAALPAALRRYEGLACTWLKVSHFGKGQLWIPVRHARFMQDWCSAGLPWLWHEDNRLHVLFALDDIIARFSSGLPEASLFYAFAQECEVALEHRETSEAERERWFSALKSAGPDALPLEWHARLLHYDRMGAFLDHPFYPTARAKLGFDAQALAAYSPEFQRSFKLRWLAVPRAIYYPSIANEQGWPSSWPTFADVGLPAAMADSHALVPVHPFLWMHQLAGFLSESHLADHVRRAPYACLTVAPTLSVRTVVLLDTPEWHLKLPLTIRTLGAKNIRTIKPSTIHDGHRVQSMLGAIAAREPTIGPRLLLTDEACGAHVDNRAFLAYILRRYPAESLQDSTLVPVASLTAQTQSGKLVAEEVSAQFYDGDTCAFFSDYLALTLDLHLRLWLRYGVALESNQQNSVVVLSRTEPRLRLLLKDNDAARVHLDYLGERYPDLATHLAGLQDQRIAVTEQLPLAQMFSTITLQLNIAVLVERMAPAIGLAPVDLYAKVRQAIEDVLHVLDAEGEDIALARRVLLDEDRLYIKYLLIAATLAEKTETGAADVNKFYGRSAPNFLRTA